MNSDAAYVIGLDGGGTKTIAHLSDPKGNVLAQSQGGPTNFQICGVDQTARTILDLVETCCHTVGCSISQIGSIVAGLAGTGRPADQRRVGEGVKSSARSRGIKLPPLLIENDARIALEGAFLGRPGVIVIAGTGSIVYAKDSRGRFLRAGGWGRVIGDEGSGYAIGREAFRSVAKMMDGRGRKSLIARYIGTKFGLKTQKAIIDAVYRDGIDLASAAPLVLQAAENNDGAAKEILTMAAEELVATIKAVISAMKGGSGHSQKKIPLALTGSLIVQENSYQKRIRVLIRKNLPGVVIRKPIATPVRGAVLMAIARTHSTSKRKSTSTFS